MSSKELSVHGHGGSLLEIFVLIIVPAVGILLRNLFLPWITHGSRYASQGKTYWWKFLADFVLIVAPIVGTQTILADSVRLVHVTMLSMIFLLLVFMVCEYAMTAREGVNSRQVMNRVIEEHHQSTMFLTYLRSSIFLLVAVAILAVDFSIMPRRFAKTEKFGHSLMDVGVAAFICALGLVEPLKTSTRREESERKRAHGGFSAVCSSTFFLVLLGLGRTILLTILGYPYEVSEYGIHWNFFYTIAVVTMVTHFLPKQCTLVTATLFTVGHEISLHYLWQDWILDDYAPRDGFFAANREGICSLPGYIALFYYSRAIGRFIAKTGIRLRSWANTVVYVLALSVIVFLLESMAEYLVGPPSRRLLNLPYILSMVSLCAFLLSACMAVQVVTFFIWAFRFPHFGSEENPWATCQPCLMESINKHSLVFFLVSNVSTGVVNMSLRQVFGWESSLLLPDVPSLIILFCHSLICCAIVHSTCAKTKA